MQCTLPAEEKFTLFSGKVLLFRDPGEQKRFRSQNPQGRKLRGDPRLAMRDPG